VTDEELRGWARGLVNRAVKCGAMPKASALACVDCGLPAKCYDHRDYRKPLKVDAVCDLCDSRRGAGQPYNSNVYDARAKRHREDIANAKKKIVLMRKGGASFYMIAKCMGYTINRARVLYFQAPGNIL
jgi:hypothetical protein